MQPDVEEVKRVEALVELEFFTRVGLLDQLFNGELIGVVFVFGVIFDQFLDFFLKQLYVFLVVLFKLENREFVRHV